jgi:hypothetical protein
MSQTLTPNNQQVSIYNALVPREGPKSVSIPINFSAGATALIDFTTAYENTSFSSVQSVWVDNFNNPNSITFTVQSTGQTIEVPADAQGIFPVIAASRPKITAYSAGAVIVPTLWLNVPMPQGTWYKSGNAGGGNVNVTNASIPVSFAIAPKTPAAPAAFTIATGGVAVTAFAGGTIVNGAVITNPAAASESLFIDFVNAAQTAVPGTLGTCFELKPGQSFEVPGGIASAVSANAVTAAHAFSAVRY